MKQMEAVMTNESREPLSTGFDDLDALISGGFYPSELTVIGARPGMGKTALALSMLQHIAVEKQIPAGFFSLEMSYSEVGLRMFTQISRLPQDKIWKGLLSPPQWDMLGHVVAGFYNSPLYTVDSPGLTILDITALARTMVTRHGVRIIFLDCLGLIVPENTDKPRPKQVIEITRSLKQLAIELSVPVVAFSQMSCKAEKEGLSISVLRDINGSIGQIADLVIFVSREKQDKSKRLVDNLMQDAVLIVAKNSHGSTGSVRLSFDQRLARFNNRENRGIERMPDVQKPAI
jgi:replicative DNA helicase